MLLGDDLEAYQKTEYSSGKPPKDPDLVAWDGPKDPENPMNWTTRRKWAVSAVVSLFTLMAPISSSSVSPALKQLSKELHMSNEIETEMALSIFVLGFAIGPLFFGPVSEVFGRKNVLQVSNFFYLAWNLGCGFAQNKAEMFVFRFFAGVGGSAPLAIGGGVLGEIWRPDQRGKAVGIYSLAPLLGPCIGPIAGGWIAEKSTWRWVFWSTSALALVVQVAGFFFLRETHAPTLLRRKKDRLVRITGNECLHTGPGSDKSLISGLRGALIRPARLLITQPIVQVISLYMAYLFGLIYLIAVAFPDVWFDVYHESPGIGGLNFISQGVGFVLGAQINMHFIDRIYQRLKRNNNDVGLPEFRVPSMFVGSLLIPIGLFWFGWSVHGRIHWIMPDIGIGIFAAGTIVCLQSMQGYIIDSYSRFAASGLAAIVVLRSLAGFAFPLFAPYLFSGLGYGWGTSVLAFMSIALGVPAPFIFWKYGARLRAASKYAAG
ncbi:major facilitator superfamily domain-containing protein [Xylariaceae sp. FL0016]|nr:major facilitator superfamily domain-containing protein [Xylariaceae sp. FL0016]